MLGISIAVDVALPRPVNCVIVCGVMKSLLASSVLVLSSCMPFDHVAIGLLCRFLRVSAFFK